MPVKGYRKRSDDSRCRHVSTYLNEAEFLSLKEEARICGMTQAAFVRERLAGHVPRAQPSRDTSEMIYHLGRIGSNLNQLARQANAGRYPIEPILMEAIDELASVIATINEPAP